MLIAMIASLALLTLKPNDTTKAKHIFEICRTKLKSAKSIRGTLVGTTMGPDKQTFNSTFELQKPKSYRFISPDIELYSNGKIIWHYLVAQQEYFKTQVTNNARVDNPPVFGFESFFGYSTIDSLPYFIKSTEFSTAKIDGKSCAVMTVHLESFERDDKMILYVDTRSTMPLGWDQEFGGTKMAYRYNGLKLNETLDAKAFDWKPPAGVKERVMKTRSDLPR